MKKIMIMALAAMFAVAMAACGDKTEGTGSGTVTDTTSGSTTATSGDETVLASTHWELYTDDLYFHVWFSNNHGTSGTVRVDDVWVLKTVESEQSATSWVGKFTYGGTATSGSGTLVFHEEESGDDAGTTPFTINGTTLTLTFQGETYNLPKN